MYKSGIFCCILQLVIIIINQMLHVHVNLTHILL